MVDFHSLNLHHQDPDIFKAALELTEAETGFTAELIEKDYYCSVVLQYLFREPIDLVFKGGTCLGKVYAGFYRLSEDLDFMIPVDVNETRSQRRNRMNHVKEMFNSLPGALQGITIEGPLIGHNNSKQYIGEIVYDSATVKRENSIKVEISLREPLLNPASVAAAQTLLVGPFGSPAIRLPAAEVIAMSLEEAYSEKIRAALTRREPAIRDFFDISYADQNLNIDFGDHNLIQMARDKISVPGNDPINLSIERRAELEKQLKGQLQPVLRPDDFERFDLTHSIKLVQEIATKISEI